MCCKKKFEHIDYNFKEELNADQIKDLRNKVLDMRNFHYENFNKWSKYFYIIIGALFAGYYATLGSSISGSMQLLLIMLGYCVSIGWILSNKGYHYWEMHWTYFLVDIEKSMPEKDKIYSVFYWGKYNGKEWKLRNGNYWRMCTPANVSTSRIALLISYLVTFAWGMLWINNCGKLSEIIADWYINTSEFFAPILKGATEFAFVLFATVFIVCIVGHLTHSKIMHGLRTINKEKIDVNQTPNNKDKEDRLKTFFCNLKNKITFIRIFGQQAITTVVMFVVISVSITLCAYFAYNRTSFQQSAVFVENRIDEQGKDIPLMVSDINNISQIEETDSIGSTIK